MSLFSGNIKYIFHGSVQSTTILDFPAWELVWEGQKLKDRKVQYLLLHYCACSELKTSKHGSHFEDMNL